MCVVDKKIASEREKAVQCVLPWFVVVGKWQATTYTVARWLSESRISKYLARGGKQTIGGRVTRESAVWRLRWNISCDCQEGKRAEGPIRGDPFAFRLPERRPTQGFRVPSHHARHALGWHSLVEPWYLIIAHLYKVDKWPPSAGAATDPNLGASRYINPFIVSCAYQGYYVLGCNEWTLTLHDRDHQKVRSPVHMLFRFRSISMHFNWSFAILQTWSKNKIPQLWSPEEQINLLLSF